MNVIETGIEGLIIIEPKVFGDDRGYFFESYNERAFTEKVGPVHFVQDNESKSRYGVVRGCISRKGSLPRRNSSGSCRDPCWTWPWTCAKDRPRTGNGMPRS